MAVKWNGPLGNQLDDMKNKTFIGLGASFSNTKCEVFGATFISSPADFDALIERYTRSFGQGVFHG